ISSVTLGPIVVLPNVTNMAMKLYRKKFLIIVAVGFVTIFGWSIITSYISTSVQTASAVTRPTNSFVTVPTDLAKNEVSLSRKSKHQNSASSERLNPLGKARNIVCDINGEYKVNCVKLVSSKET